jgi:hypothetical protein
VENTSSVIHLNITVQLNTDQSNYCALQRQSHFQTIYAKETGKVWHKNYKLCDCSTIYSHMCNMPVYSGKDRECMPPSMTTTDATITGHYRSRFHCITNVRCELIDFISAVSKTGVHIFKFLISYFVNNHYAGFLDCCVMLITEAILICSNI